MEKALRAQRHHLDSSTALWTLSALALAACGGGGGGGPTVTDGAAAAGNDEISPEDFYLDSVNLIHAGAAPETFDGSTDEVDVVIYAESPSGITIDLSNTDENGYATGSGGHAEGDKLKDIDHIVGSPHDDTLSGDVGYNEFWGGAGADTIDGAEGYDDEYGQWHDGSDAVFYADSPSGVTIDLSVRDENGYATGSGGYAEGDKLKNIEQIFGSAYDDVLIGGAGYANNWLEGGAGDDYLYGGFGDDVLVGGAGADTIDGGDFWDYWENIDAVYYTKSPFGVTIDLSDVQDDGYVHGTGGDAQGDRLKYIEDLIGSEHDDVLTGDNWGNELYGRGGDDTLNGGVGDDWLDGGDGADILIGGTDADVFWLEAEGVANPSDADVIMDFSSEDTLYWWDHAGSFYYTNNLDEGVGTAGANDTVIYGDAAKTEIIVILADYNAPITAADFEDIRRWRPPGDGTPPPVTDPTPPVGTDPGDDSTLPDPVDPVDPPVDPVDPVDDTSPEGFYADLEGFYADLADDFADLADADLADIGITILYGGAAPETFDGSADTYDVVFYTNSPSGVTIDMSMIDENGYSIGSGGDAAGDKLKNIDHIVGSPHDDVLTGDAGDNSLWGGAGADTLDGGSGTGVDDALYLDSPSGVTIDLSSTTNGYATGSGGDAAGDKLKNIENIWGSQFADVLIGDTEDNTLWGGAGADTLDGGTGVDTASYFGSPSAVTINLSETVNGYATGSGGHAAGDKLRNIEDIDGSDFNDVLTGDAEDNWLFGWDGDDYLSGGAGDDDLNGWEGDDEIHGGADDDDLNGWDGNDILIGGAGEDWLIGWDGNDRLDGGAGEDWLDGGDGADVFVLEVDSPVSDIHDADVIADFSSEDSLTFSTATNGKNLWFENGVNAGVQNSGANDTVIYGNAAGTEIIVRLADYDGDITAADFEIPGYVGDIEML